MPLPDYTISRNYSPGLNTSGSSSSGSSPESSAESSFRGAGSGSYSYSSETTPPSSASSTPPNDSDAKAAPGLASSTQPDFSQLGNPSLGSNQDHLRQYQQPQHTAATPAVPLFYSTNVTSPRNVAAIQAQVEAAYPPHPQRPAKSTIIRDPQSTQSGQSLKAHLAASSTARDYYASEEDLGAALTRVRGSGSGTSKRASTPAPGSECPLNETGREQPTWMDELMSKGLQDGPLSGESLIDAVILYNYHRHVANQSLPTTSFSARRPRAVPVTNASGSSSSTSSLPTPTPSNPYSFPRQPTHPRSQQHIYSPRPSLPIATKQLPYQNLAAYQGVLSSVGMPMEVDSSDSSSLTAAPDAPPGAT